MFIQILDARTIARTIYDVFPFTVVSQETMWQIKIMWFDKFWLKCGEKFKTVVVNNFANMLTYLDIEFKVPSVLCRSKVTDLALNQAPILYPVIIASCCLVENTWLCTNFQISQRIAVTGEKFFHVMVTLEDMVKFMDANMVQIRVLVCQV